MSHDFHVLHVDASKQVRMCVFCLQENVEWCSEIETEDVCEVEQCRWVVYDWRVLLLDVVGSVLL